jgi:RNase P subunit RPR2
MDERTENHLRYIWDMAHAVLLMGNVENTIEMSLTGPVVSRELLYSTFTKVLRQMEVSMADHLLQRLCQSCGSIFIPGITMKVTLRKCISKTNPIRNQLRYTCFVCDHTILWDGALAVNQETLKKERKEYISLSTCQKTAPTTEKNKNTSKKKIDILTKRKQHPLRHALIKTPSSSCGLKLSDFLSSL